MIDISYKGRILQPRVSQGYDKILQMKKGYVRKSLAKQNGYLRIGLGVGIDNARARSLYVRRGYEDAGFGGYRTGGCYIDRNGREQSWEEMCNYLIKELAKDLKRPRA